MPDLKRDQACFHGHEVAEHTGVDLAPDLPGDRMADPRVPRLNHKAPVGRCTAERVEFGGGPRRLLFDVQVLARFGQAQSRRGRLRRRQHDEGGVELHLGQQGRTGPYGCRPSGLPCE